jgi:hypothetical protein
MTSFDTVRQLALALPDVQERPSYGTPSFRVRDKLFARLLPDGESIVLKIDFAERAALTASAPETFSATPHYQNYPMMIVRLATVDPRELEQLLVGAWRHTAPKRLVALHDAASGAPPVGER